jgi:uncharacterized membrane protein YecN with MAPEG domain
MPAAGHEQPLATVGFQLARCTRYRWAAMERDCVGRFRNFDTLDEPRRRFHDSRRPDRVAAPRSNIRKHRIHCAQTEELVMNITVLSSGLLALLYAALSVNVSITRLRKRRDSSITDAQLTKAIRAHGNASEYIPLLIASFLFLGVSGSTPTLAAISVLATISRVAHAAGMFRIANVSERHPLRYYGALGTYVCLFAVAVLILRRAF